MFKQLLNLLNTFVLTGVSKVLGLDSGWYVSETQFFEAPPEFVACFEELNAFKAVTMSDSSI